MMDRDLPYYVEIDGEKHPIRNNCDFRVVLDVISALNDEEYDMPLRLEIALCIFYEDSSKIKNGEKALMEMMRIINLGEESKQRKDDSKPIMDWNHDYNRVIPPINKVLGYETRQPDRLTHWWTFVGAYYEIGDCSFAQIVSIRSKKNKGKKLEKYEEEFYRANREAIDLPRRLSEEEKAWLSDDW